MLMDATRSALLVVDVQARLLPHMTTATAVVNNCAILLKAAARLGVPVLVSEQYPQGLGATVATLMPLLPPGAVVEKVHFSCLNEPAFVARFAALDRAQAVVAGIEAHVCVLQTVERLLERGIATFVVADATSSRTALSHQTALSRVAAAGAGVVTTEMVVFEWLGRAATPEFRELSVLIK